MMSYYGFGLHFSDNYWCWASFHIPTGHLYVFGQMCMWVFFVITLYVLFIYFGYQPLITYAVCKYFLTFLDYIFIVYVCVCVIFCVVNKIILSADVILFLRFQFGCLLFILAYLLYFGVPILCWIEVVRVGTLVLVMILEEKLSAFHHWVWY